MERDIKFIQSEKEKKDKQLNNLNNELNLLKNSRKLQEDGFPLKVTSDITERKETNDVNFSKQKAEGNESYRIETYMERNKTNLEDPLRSLMKFSSSTRGRSLEITPLMPHLPVVTPETKLKKSLTSKTSLNVLPVPKQIPNGFVPIRVEKRLQSKEDTRDVLNLPERYVSQILNEAADGLNQDTSLIKRDEIDDKENVANEIDTINEKEDENQLDTKIENLQNQLKLHIDNLQQPDEQEPEEPADEDGKS